jgi:WD40 repeat protein
VGAGIVYLLSSQYALNAGVTLRTLTNFQVNTLYSAAVSPDGATVAFGDSHSQIWFSSVPSANTTIPESSSLTVDASGYQSIYGVAYSPKNGKYLAAAAGEDMDGNPGTLAIWDVTAKSLYAHYTGVSSQPIAVTFSPGGNAIVVGEDGCGKVLLCTN